MTNFETLHVCYFPQGDTNTVNVLRTLEHRPLLSLVVATSGYQLSTILKALPLDQKVSVWIHLNRGETNHGQYIYFEEERRLKENGIINPDAYLPLFTTGDVNSIEGIPDKDIPNIRINHNNKAIYNLQIFNSENQQYLPEPSSPRFLTATTYKRARIDVYPEFPQDWQLQKLKEEIPEDQMQAILGEVIGEDIQSVDLEIKGGGFSGAWVIRVEIVRSNDKRRAYLLKIVDSKGSTDLKAEYVTRMTDAFSDLPNNTFVGAYPNSYDVIYGWHCLRYKFLENKDTLRKFLRNSLTNETQRKKTISRVFSELSSFEKAGDLNFNIHRDPVIPYKQNSLYYKGLMLNRGLTFKAAEVLESIRNKFLAESRSYEIIQRIHHLQKFILKADGDFRDKSILEISKGFGTPYGMPHGDFHTANIMCDKSGEEVTLIDFANVPTEPTLHRFLDIGKFSSDIEISVFPDDQLIGNPYMLSEWMSCHKRWLHHKEMSTENQMIVGIYKINSQLRDTVLISRIPEEWKIRGALGKEEAIRQFQMIRLHYFLKQIAYNNEIREKILFFVRASLDILDYLIGAPYEND